MIGRTLSSLHWEIDVSGVLWQSISEFIQHSNDEVFVFKQSSQRKIDGGGGLTGGQRPKVHF